jgi:predicted RNA-binding protein with TRAM domain
MDHTNGTQLSGVRCPISPRKRSPRNAKNKRGRREIPIEMGKTYEVDITEMSPNGEGIARVKGFPIFVPETKLGEHVTVTITYLDTVSADSKKTQ